LNIDVLHLVQDRDEWQAVVDMVEPSGSIKDREFFE
jgi:hypothetical protein